MAERDAESQTMQAITSRQAQQNLAGVISHVIEDAEPVIICTDCGQQVVCLSLDEFNSWKETLYLLSSPANAEHLPAVARRSESGCRA